MSKYVIYGKKGDLRETIERYFPSQTKENDGLIICDDPKALVDLLRDGQIREVVVAAYAPVKEDTALFAPEVTASLADFANTRGRLFVINDYGTDHLGARTVCPAEVAIAGAVRAGPESVYGFLSDGNRICRRLSRKQYESLLIPTTPGGKQKRNCGQLN